MSWTSMLRTYYIINTEQAQFDFTCKILLNESKIFSTGMTRFSLFQNVDKNDEQWEHLI